MTGRTQRKTSRGRLGRAAARQIGNSPEGYRDVAGDASHDGRHGSVEFLEIGLDRVQIDENNARRHDPRNIEAIKMSLARFGQQKPIVIDDEDRVIAGNGTVVAARALGWKTIRAARSGLRGREAAAYAVADNRTAELAEWDEAELIRQLLEMDGDQQRAAGFIESELRELLADDEASAALVPVDTKAPPKLAFALISIELGRWSAIAERIAELAATEGVQVWTTTSDGDGVGQD